jgi:predicted membrane protein
VKKFFLLTFILFINLNSSVLVYKAQQNINYKQKITPLLVQQYSVNNLSRVCSPVEKKDFLTNEYRAKLILKKGRIICKKDIYIAQKNKIIFNFGNIEIEKDGKIIKETEQYIRIRDINGKIQKIYKDGR